MADAHQRSSRQFPLMLRITAVVGGVVLLTVVTGTNQSQQPTYRANADIVLVDTTVFDKGRPVSGLKAGDFALRDNGILQTVELVAADSRVPLDLSLVVDISGNTAKDIDRLWTDILSIGSTLRPGDRLGLVTFAETIQEAFPLAEWPVDLPARPTAQAGSGATLDALVQALVRPGSPARRHVIVQFTGARDLTHVTQSEQLVKVAARCDATVMIVLAKHERGFGPFEHVKKALSEAARMTGGDVLDQTDLVPAFRKILESLAKGYVLSYVPTGVDRKGWHVTDVTIVKKPSLTVAARKGYFGG